MVNARYDFRPAEAVAGPDETRPVRRWRVKVCGRFTNTYFIESDDFNEAKRIARRKFEQGELADKSRHMASFVGAYSHDEEPTGATR